MQPKVVVDSSDSITVRFPEQFSKLAHLNVQTKLDYLIFFLIESGLMNLLTFPALVLRVSQAFH